MRNSVGMDFHPVTKELWFTNNGRDWVNDELPNDTLHHVTRKGMNFGFPFCHQGDLVDDEYGKGRSCKEFDPPTLKLGPHVAALGMRFYTGKQFPAEFKNNIFIAEHGSWNRSKKTGFNVTRVVLDAKGKVVKHEPFATGWLNGEAVLGPAGGRAGGARRLAAGFRRRGRGHLPDLLQEVGSSRRPAAGPIGGGFSLGYAR